VAALALLSIAWIYPFVGALRGSVMAMLPLALLSAVLAVESWIGHERGRVRWKGRTLPPRVPIPAADA
jgi:hypothetical protein